MERPATANSFWVMHRIHYEHVSIQKNRSLNWCRKEWRRPLLSLDHQSRHRTNIWPDVWAGSVQLQHLRHNYSSTDGVRIVLWLSALDSEEQQQTVRSEANVWTVIWAPAAARCSDANLPSAVTPAWPWCTQGYARALLYLYMLRAY